MIEEMSGDDSDEWEDAFISELNGIDKPVEHSLKKRAKMPLRASGDLRSLIFCTDKSPERVLDALEDQDLYKKRDIFHRLCDFLVNGLTNAGWAVWQALKPYHANLLAYQFAAGIQAGTLLAPTDIKMIRSCYEIIVKTFERHTSNSNRPTYTQWVARETVQEMANIDIIFRFLRKHDPQIAKMLGPGKLP